MIVGEQPGDQEDQAGRPFVGPAGQLLGEYLERAGIDRSQAYVTNAVKHFKFVWKGKRRLHQSPGAKEIDTCRWWLEAERDIVKPRLVLALGASAARGLIGKTVSISKARGARSALRTAPNCGSPRTPPTCCVSKAKRARNRHASLRPTSRR